MTEERKRNQRLWRWVIVPVSAIAVVSVITAPLGARAAELPAICNDAAAQDVRTTCEQLANTEMEIGKYNAQTRAIIAIKTAGELLGQAVKALSEGEGDSRQWLARAQATAAMADRSLAEAEEPAIGSSNVPGH